MPRPEAILPELRAQLEALKDLHQRDLERNYHSFASHLLQAHYDIRAIQQLLRHSDVRTTMIGTHTVKSVTMIEAKSPLDF